MNKEIRWLFEEKYHGVKTPEFRKDIQRLQAGEPLAYIIGWVDFLGCRIDLSARPLIPRPETEFWVEQVISHQSLVTSPIKILDLFSGSGCIGIALLKHLPNATVDFGEKDLKLCEQIKKNILFNNIDPARTRVIQTDIFSNITNTYDVIFANPPYIDRSKKDVVQDSVLRHEPHEALFANDNGLFFIKKLLTDATKYLIKDGTLYIEFGEGRKGTVMLLAKKAGWKTEFRKDQFGKWRVVKCARATD